MCGTTRMNHKPWNWPKEVGHMWVDGAWVHLSEPPPTPKIDKTSLFCLALASGARKQYSDNPWQGRCSMGREQTGTFWVDGKVHYPCFGSLLYLFIVVVQSLTHVQLFASPVDCSLPGSSVLQCLLELVSFRIDWFYLLGVQGTPKSFLQHNIVQKNWCLQTVVVIYNCQDSSYWTVKSTSSPFM